MATILYAWELGAGVGHIAPFRGLAKTLITRGHKCVCAFRDLSQVKKLFEGVKVSLLQAPVKLNPVRNIIDPCTSFVHVLHNTGFEDPDDLEGRLDAWCSIYDQVKPDLVIFDHSPTAMLALRGYPTRRVVIGSGFLVPPDEYPMRNIRPWVPSDQKKNEADEAQVLAVMNQVIARRQWKPLQRVGELYSDVDDTILDTFPELDHYGARTNGAYWGIRSYLKGVPPEWPTGSGRKIFAYLKPFDGLEKLLTAILKDIGASTILVPDRIDEALLKKFAAPNLFVARDLLDLELVARQCDLAVLNANHSTCAQLLLGGVPLFMLPLTLEQTLIARAIDRSGAGALVDPHYADEFLPKLTAMLEMQRFRTGAQRFAQKYAGFNGLNLTEQMASRFEELLRPDFKRQVYSPLASLPPIAPAGNNAGTDLSAAIVLHQQGKVQQATVIYQNVLRDNPLNPDALHLLGVATLQAGNPAKAIELIGRATALQPNNPAYFANLAEACRTSGDLDAAVQHNLTALRLRPNYPEALNNLGLALRAQGKLNAAVARFRELLKLNPKSTQAYNNLGGVYMDLKDRPQAIDCFKQSLALEPRSAEAHSNLGQCLLEIGEPQEALRHCRTALELHPWLLEAHINYGNVIRELGGMAEARRCYTFALENAPPTSFMAALASNNMGQAAQEERLLPDAINWYRRALQIAPDAPQILANLASALIEDEQYDEARRTLDRALARDPRHTPALIELGKLCQRQNQFAAAGEHIGKAIEGDPASSAAHTALGEWHSELGELPQAEAAFRRAIELDARNATALGALATLRHADLPENDAAALRKLLAEPQLKPGSRVTLQYALAKVLDARKDFQSAAELLQAANTLHLQRGGYNYAPADHREFIDQTIVTFTPEFFARTRGFGSESTRPIFIVGLPRSGSTLLEQILAGHSKVHGAGELKVVPNSLLGLPARLKSDRSAHELLRAIDRETVAALAGQVLAELNKLDAAHPHITDKLPDNYLILGYIALLFPRAKIIHCRRDLRDIAVSCWSTHFRDTPWSCTYDTIASRFAEHRRVMAHWRNVLPQAPLEIDYEETVRAPETVARRLLEFCGLDWEPQCLNFHANQRPVRTASVTQVRQPVYQTSVERWRNYEPYLKPLFDKLPTN